MSQEQRMAESLIDSKSASSYTRRMPSDELFHGFVSMQTRGLVALPASLRKRYRLDEAGAQVEITERGDGVIELRPAIAVPASDAWFWSTEWQAGEREVDRFLAAGQVTVTDGVEEFLTSLPGHDSSAP